MTFFFISGLRRCESTFHQFLTDMMERLRVTVANLGEQPKHPTAHGTSSEKSWQMQEAVYLAYLMNSLRFSQPRTYMYSSEKMQISDTKEYQDFLQLFTGKSKTRETSKFYGDNSPTALTLYNTCKSNEDL